MNQPERRVTPKAAVPMVLLLAGLALEAPPVPAAPMYAALPAAAVRRSALDWVAAQAVKDKQILEQIGKLWAFGDETPAASELFRKVIDTFCLADPATRQFVDACRLVQAPLIPPSLDVLNGESRTAFYVSSLRLYYARYLCRRRMYESALDVLASVDGKTVVDPASYLFFKAVCEHRMMKKQEGLATLDALLERTQDVPARYAAVAVLMQHDLKSLKDKSLDTIARKMSDVERRLDLGRGGPKVQKVEDEIIANLDELIKKLEEQQSNAQGGGMGNSGGNRSSNPAQDSTVKGTKAPGEVDAKNIGTKGGWGSLPPKEAARAKNLINRQFPVHYRQAVEEYFKKLAKRRGNPGK